MREGENNNNRRPSIVQYFLLGFFLFVFFGSLVSDEDSTNLRDSTREMKDRQLLLKMKTILGQDLAYSYDPTKPYALNISGTYYGEYTRIPKRSPIHDEGDYDVDVRFIKPKIPNDPSINSESGDLEITLWDTLTDVNYFHMVTGDITFLNHTTSEAITSIHMFGYYFASSGRLTMFANTGGGQKIVIWKNPYLNETQLLSLNEEERSISILHNQTSSFGKTKREYLIEEPDYEASLEDLNKTAVRTLRFPSSTDSSPSSLRRCYYKWDSQLLSSTINSTIDVPKRFQTAFYSNFLPYPEETVLNATAGFLSTNCNESYAFTFSGVSLNTDFIQNEAQVYSFEMIVVTFIVSYILIVELNNISTISQQQRTATDTVFFQCIFDELVAFYHISLSVVSPYLFGDFSALVMQSFFLSIFLELRVFLILWKVQHPSIFEEGWQRVNKELSRIYMKLYGLLFVGLFVLYYGGLSTYVYLFLLSSFWVPQIYMNLKEGHRTPFSYRYLLMVTLCRSFLPLYLLLHPYNLYLLYYKTSLPAEPIVLLILYMFAQCLILCYQKKYGAYSILPRCLKPVSYDYHHIPAKETTDTVECAICMCEIDLNTVNSRDVMVTPCNHIFHTECLSHWIEIKQDCPICRSKLPDLL